MKLDIQKFATPKTGTLTKVYLSDKEYPTEADLDLVMYTEEIPSPEEAAEAVTYQTTDMASEEQSKGPKKASTMDIPILYTRSQHKSLKETADSDETKWVFIRYPKSTCGENEEPLVKSFSAQADLVGDTITVGDMIKDTLRLYRNSPVKETYGLPVASTPPSGS